MHSAESLKVLSMWESLSVARMVSYLSEEGHQNVFKIWIDPTGIKVYQSTRMAASYINLFFSFPSVGNIVWSMENRGR